MDPNQNPNQGQNPAGGMPTMPGAGDPGQQPADPMGQPQQPGGAPTEPTMPAPEAPVSDPAAGGMPTPPTTPEPGAQGDNSGGQTPPTV